MSWKRLECSRAQTFPHGFHIALKSLDLELARLDEVRDVDLTWLAILHGDVGFEALWRAPDGRGAICPPLLASCKIVRRHCGALARVYPTRHRFSKYLKRWRNVRMKSGAGKKHRMLNIDSLSRVKQECK